MFEIEKILHDFLIESEILTESEFEVLLENTKTRTIRQLTKKFLEKVSDKMSKINTKKIDRSRGNISRLRLSDKIQSAISKIESLTYLKGYKNKDLEDHLSIINRSFLKLREHSDVFRQGYREKKILTISYYQALITALIRSVAYLIATTTTTRNGEVELRDNIKIIKTSELRTLERFLEEEANGRFNKNIQDVESFREEFFEISEEYYGILENGDIIDMVKDGLSRIYRQLDKGGALTRLIYNASGILLMILSMRDVIYPAVQSVFNNDALLGFLDKFTNFDKLSVGDVGDVVSMNDKIPQDALESTRLAQREIDIENKEIKQFIQTVKSEETPNPEDIESDEGFSLGF